MIVTLLLAGIIRKMSTVPNINPENVNSWFGSLADEALDRNTRSVCTWSKYKDDLEETKKILSWLPNKLKHDVMVPIGPRALMRGKIVHTNELLVNLGETWFVKVTAKKTMEICDRRIGKCYEMLDRLKKEEELLRSKKSLPEEKEAFGNEERPEIVEYVSEEEHEEWKKRHREKEKEYRRKLAEIRNKEKKPIETEQDLWDMLDELELREELEDELCRLNAEEGDTDEEGDGVISETIEECNEISQGNSNETIEECLISDDNNKKTEKVTKRKVSFIDNDTTDDEPLVLHIKHSEVEATQTTYSGFINSPSDIYNAYIKTLAPKSILKNTVNVNQEKEMNSIKDDSEDDEVVDVPVLSGIMLPDVISKDFSIKEGIDVADKVSSLKEPTRKISKFKASRMKKS